LQIGGKTIKDQDETSVFDLMSKRLQTGDCILIVFRGTLPKPIEDRIDTFRKKVVKQHASLRVLDLSKGQEDVHSIPDVIWWNTPFDNPRSQAEARYFWNEKELGTAAKGFEAVLAQIQLQKPKKIIMIGSSYPLQYSYSARETPFGENLEPRLRNA